MHSLATIPELPGNQRSLNAGDAKKDQTLFFKPKPNMDPANDADERKADVVTGKPLHTHVALPQQNNSKTNSAHPFFIQRAPNPSTLSIPTVIPAQVGPRYLPSGVISRTEFDTYVQSNYRVRDVHTGTQTEQETKIVRHGIPTVTIPNWQQWDPGSASEGYTNIIEGIEDMINTVGAIPTINTIIFFQQAYEPDASGIGIAQPDVGASFGAGELTIYESYSGTHRFPLARSQAGVTTPVEANNTGMFIRQNIAHELGHGVAEAAMASQNLQTFNQYNATVGWVGSPSVLYDMGQQEVRDAIANNTPLPAQHIITPSRWNDPAVIEQPMTRYSVLGGPSEDFAEAITAFIYEPAALQQRSPRRFGFIQANMNTWKTQMQSMTPGIPRPPVGDFPEPRRDQRIA